MTLQTWLLFGIGLTLLIAGAQLLVKGAAALARAFGISSLVIGLTVVAFGTSTPELAVTVQGAVDGHTDLAVGNIVGSNIFNVLFILGLAAMIAPLTVSRQLVRLDVPLMIGVSVLLLVLALDARLSMFDGTLLAVGVVAYTAFAVREGRRAGEDDPGAGASQPPARRLVVAVLLVIAGLALLVLGARWLVDAAIDIARALGLSETVIGLTLVAAGTSLPEVATSVVAAARGERDIAVGNVVGSNLYNILAILGAAALMVPQGLTVGPSVLRFDLPVMIAAAAACLPVFFTGGLIARWEGVLFFAYYIAYATYLALDSSGHDALPAYSAVMLEFVPPLTMVTLLVLLLQALRRPAVRD